MTVALVVTIIFLIISVVLIISAISEMICWTKAKHPVECICTKYYKICDVYKNTWYEFFVTFNHNGITYKNCVKSNYTIKRLKKEIGIDIQNKECEPHKHDTIYWKVDPPVTITMYIDEKDPKTIYCNRRFPKVYIVGLLFGLFFTYVTIKMIAFIVFDVPFL